MWYLFPFFKRYSVSVGWLVSIGGAMVCAGGIGWYYAVVYLPALRERAALFTPLVMVPTGVRRAQLIQRCAQHAGVTSRATKKGYLFYGSLRAVAFLLWLLSRQRVLFENVVVHDHSAGVRVQARWQS